MRTLCAAIFGASSLLLLAACEPTYESPPPMTSPTVTSPSAMYAAPTAPSVAVVTPQRPCIYTSRSYVSGAAINPPELPGTTLQCVNGAWHSI